MSRVTVLVEGGLLPDDLLEKIADGSAQGQRAADFGITSGRLSDEIMRAFSDAQSYWSAFQHRYERASKGGRESTTTVTRESFVIPLLEALSYKLEFKRSLAVGDQSFNISHLAGDDASAPPVNIVSADETLDERGSARRSAHSTLQEYLNLSDSVWGLATNGRRLRLLRNSSRLAKPRYIEFDLAGMMESNVYSDFHLLYRLLHRTRLPKSAVDASECWLEKYFNEGVEQGSRVRDRLRDGVVDALKIFGNAFLSHEKSGHLREHISAGCLTAPAFYRELLRLVYRLLFLMVGEERRLMFPESRENEDRRVVFTEHYGINRLRARVESYVGEDPEIDLWESLKQTFNVLRDDRAAHMLGMAALNGELFGQHGCPHLDGGGDPERSAFCRNHDLLRAIDSLSKFDDDGIRRRVNFAALDVEELGSVYESLLEYHPQLSASPTSFDLVWGSERKSTGSYYTPPDLVRELIDSALVPVVQERLKPAKTKDDREKAILSTRVIDPAAGSGHFLLAAARRLGRELARIRTDEEEPSPSAFRRAVRDVIRECIYAVDKNPLAVDLCKVALWIEGHNAGQPLSFPDVFTRGGFDVVLGNPPWDKIQPEEQKFFATVRPDIATASAKARKALIESLPVTDPKSDELWRTYKHSTEATCRFISGSGRFHFAGAGNLNSYRVFTEFGSDLIRRDGRAGLIVQTGIATDESGKELFAHLMSDSRLVRFLDFENRKRFFPEIDTRFRFALITLAGTGIAPVTQFGWLLHSVEDLGGPGRLISLSARDLSLFNPSSKTCPIFVSHRDLKISRQAYENGTHIFLGENHRIGNIDFHGELFNMTRDSRHFVPRSEQSTTGLLPLYEAKYVHQFDHRFATVVDGQVVETTGREKADPDFHATTAYLVKADEVQTRLAKRAISTTWLSGFRSVASSTNERTAIMAAFPVAAVGNSLNLVIGLDAIQTACLMANINAFLFDFCCRQKISGMNVNIWIFKQLPAIPFEKYIQPCRWAERILLRDWIVQRVLELTVTANDLTPFGRELHYQGAPFRWDDDRRLFIRCEVDAAFFHLYGISRDDADYVMETFPIVKRKDVERFGDYRTKRLVLEIYDAMAEAIRTGQPYQTRLSPPPGNPRAAHPTREAASENAAART